MQRPLDAAGIENSTAPHLRAAMVHTADRMLQALPQRWLNCAAHKQGAGVHALCADGDPAAGTPGSRDSKRAGIEATKHTNTASSSALCHAALRQHTHVRIRSRACGIGQPHRPGAPPAPAASASEPQTYKALCRRTLLLAFRHMPVLKTFGKL